MIPTTIITGFLGSGKTTLIAALAANANGKKLAFLINEFGETDVDGNLLKSCGIDACSDDAQSVVELPNGCICCTVANDFIPAMEAILENNPDHILIETSGLALPAPLVKAFDWPEVKGRVTVDGVIMVADAAAIAEGTLATDPDEVQKQQENDESIEHVMPIAELFEDQLSAADVVVLSKTEGLAAPAIAAVQEQLRAHSHLHKGVEVVVSPLKFTANDTSPLAAQIVGGQQALGSLLNVGGNHGQGHVHDEDDPEHSHDDFVSFAMSVPAMQRGQIPGTQAAIEQILTQPGVIRVKGVIPVGDAAGEETAAVEWVVQAVGTRLQTFFRPRQSHPAPSAGNLVVIGLKHLEATAIEQLFANAATT